MAKDKTTPDDGLEIPAHLRRDPAPKETVDRIINEAAGGPRPVLSKRLEAVLNPPDVTASLKEQIVNHGVGAVVIKPTVSRGVVVPEAEVKANVRALKAKAAKAPPKAKPKGPVRLKPPAEAVKPPPSARKPALGNRTAPKGKAILVVDMMRRKNGASRPELLAATGWKAISIKQQCDIVGVKFTAQGKHGKYRYFVKGK